MQNIIIFCQAPGDVKYALSIYESFKSKAFVSIYVINVRSMYDFINSLGLKLKTLTYIPYPKISFKNFISIIKTKRFLKRLNKEIFLKITSSRVFYFSNDIDWVTASFLATLASKNTLICWHHNDYRCVPKGIISLKEKLFLCIYKYLTSAKMRLSIFEGHEKMPYVPEFKWESYAVSMQRPVLHPSVLNIYSYKVDNIGSNAVLLFDMDYSSTIYNYSKQMKKILNILLKENYNIFIKSHPRAAHSEFIDHFDLTIIPHHIPAEFIIIDDFKLILGIASTALAEASKRLKGKGVSSIMELFDYKHTPTRDYGRDFLIKSSGGYIRFINSMETLYSTLRMQD